MSTTPQFEIPTDVRKIAEKSVEQVKTAISGYLHFLQRAVPNDVMGGSELSNKIFGYAERNVESAFEFAQRLAWISTDWNPSNAGFGKGFRRLRISALSVIRYGELITRVHAVSFASATILGESGAPRFRCIDLRRMPASWRSQVSWFNSRLTPDMANDTAHMCLSDHYMS